ncbi:Uncharacterised protein [Mycobacterium tuberculosis]|nr:Uncharacterised protein [Mycobacterium tuberculosis]
MGMASNGAFRPWITSTVLSVRRSTSCTEPVNHELSANSFGDRPTANG